MGRRDARSPDNGHCVKTSDVLRHRMADRVYVVAVLRVGAMNQGNVRKAAELIRRIDALGQLRKSIASRSGMVLGMFSAVDEHDPVCNALAFADAETAFGAIDFMVGRLRAQLVELGVGAD